MSDKHLSVSEVSGRPMLLITRMREILKQPQKVPEADMQEVNPFQHTVTGPGFLKAKKNFLKLMKFKEQHIV